MGRCIEVWMVVLAGWRITGGVITGALVWV